MTAVVVSESGWSGCRGGGPRTVIAITVTATSNIFGVVIVTSTVSILVATITFTIIFVRFQRGAALLHTSIWFIPGPFGVRTVDTRHWFVRVIVTAGFNGSSLNLGRSYSNTLLMSAHQGSVEHTLSTLSFFTLDFASFGNDGLA
jgi:hypothetical protein